MIKKFENELEKQFKRIDDIAFYNQKKVLKAFQDNRVSTAYFSGTTGYGYSDQGRENLDKIFANVFKSEDALVSPLITCGSHAISLVLYGLLRPNDILLSISGSLYDTLEDTLYGKGTGSLEDFGIEYKEIALKDNDFDKETVLSKICELKPKVIFVQRSRGYTDRTALSIAQLESIFKEIRKVYKEGYIVVDNCYGEFVEEREPIEVGADVAVGSLIKNIGGGIAQTGGYVVGTAKAIDLIARRFTSPSLAKEVGSYEMGYRNFYQGIFLAPHTVKEAIKGAYLIGKVFEEKGYKVFPSSTEPMGDIIKSIVFNNDKDLISFVQLVQKVSPVDSFALPLPWAMPGYEEEVIMAAGTFVSGASIEMSADAPIKEPYIAYFQGGLTYEHVKILAEEILNNF